MASVTALYGSILGLIIVALGINVTVHRARFKVPLGDGAHPEMLRMIRIHGNAIEYLPLAILLMLIYELTSGSRILLHVIGIVLIVARIMQSADLWSSPRARFGRIAGQSATWASIIVLAVANLIRLV